MQQRQINKICIVIVTYNGKRWLTECLATTAPYSVIIVDNCSTDGTPELIRSYYPEIVLLEQKENLGFGRANNIGISYALEKKADYVFLLNQDAFLEPNTISSLLEISGNNTEYGILSPIHLNGKGTRLEPVFSYYMYKCNENGLLSDLLGRNKIENIYQVPMVNAAAWLITRSTLEIVGGFNPLFFLYGEDDNYAQRINYHGLKIGICPGIYIRHDSSSNYHLYPEKGTEKYYVKFLNRIKIDYANVNTNNYLKIKSLRKYYLKKAIASLVLGDLKSYKINIKKQEILKDLDFKKEVKVDRLRAANYLSLDKTE